MYSLRSLAIVAVGIAVIVAGCGGGGARGTAAKFVTAMQSAKFDQAAEQWDLQSEGRAGNPDWDTFGSSQRHLIIQKDLAPKKATVLQQMAALFPAGAKVSSVTETGNSAQATVEGAQVKTIMLTKSGKNWAVVGFQ